MPQQEQQITPQRIAERTREILTEDRWRQGTFMSADVVNDDGTEVLRACLAGGARIAVAELLGLGPEDFSPVYILDDLEDELDALSPGARARFERRLEGSKAYWAALRALHECLPDVGSGIDNNGILEEDVIDFNDEPTRRYEEIESVLRCFVERAPEEVVG